MLLSIPNIEDLHKKCTLLNDEKDSSRNATHPARLIECLVRIIFNGLFHWYELFTGFDSELKLGLGYDSENGFPVRYLNSPI